MFARSVRPCDDSANPRWAGDYVMVKDVEIVASIPRALLQGHLKDDSLAAAKETDLKLLAYFDRRYGRHHVIDTSDRSCIHGQ